MKEKAGLLILFTIIVLGVSGILTGCCARNSDGTKTCFGTCTQEVTGYALFGSGTAPTAGRNVVVEWSDDSFATKKNYGTSIVNFLGVVAIPFKFDASYSCNAIPQIQVRSFESADGSVVWKTGNISGRYDGDTGGNSTYKTVSLTQARDVLIYLDGAGAQ